MNAKQRFIESPYRLDFEAITKTPAFKTACDYALLDMLEELPRRPNLNESWDDNSRMAGAREVIDEILKTLSQPKPERRLIRGYELTYSNPDFSGGPKL